MAMDTDRPAAPPPRDDAPAGSEQRRTASQAAPRDRRHAGRAIIRPEAGTGSRHPQTPRWPAAGTATPLRTTAKQRGGVTGKGFLPGRSGNAGGRPGGDGLMRKRLLESFQQNEAAAMAAMARRWGNPRSVQDMWELLAKLEGELGKDVANGEARGIQVILVTTDGVHRLDPDAFRAAAAKRITGPAVNGPGESAAAPR